MADGNVEILKKLYEAFRTRDLLTIMNAVDHEIAVQQTDALPWGGKYRGIAGLQDFFGKLLAHIESQVTVEQYVDAGDTVIAVGRTRGMVKKNGNAFDVPFVHVWRFKNGNAVSFEPYIATAEMLKVLGN
jgi:ketosteroid isomerase-like protein